MMPGFGQLPLHGIGYMGGRSIHQLQRWNPALLNCNSVDFFHLDGCFAGHRGLLSNLFMPLSYHGEPHFFANGSESDQGKTAVNDVRKRGPPIALSLQNFNSQAQETPQCLFIFAFPDTMPPMSIPGIRGIGKLSAGHTGAKRFAQKAVAGIELFGWEKGKGTERWPETIVVQINRAAIFPAQTGVWCILLCKVGLPAVTQGQTAHKTAKQVKQIFGWGR